MTADVTAQRPHPWALGILVFVGGACSLATEMAGARLLAPYFGASNLVWANIIGLILLYLSVGYWIGGRVADRYPYPKTLGWVVVATAATIAVLPFVSRPLFGVAADAFTGLSAGAFVGSFFATMALFALPVTALGMISPWVIRLAVTDIAGSGTVVGRMYALSTIGSLIGTFVPVLFLIPLIGTQRTILVVAATLAASAALLVGWRSLLVPAVIAALVAVPPGATARSIDGRILFEGESAYQYVQVVERPDGSRILQLNEGWAVHSIFRPGQVLADGYWDAFAALPSLTNSPRGRVAVLGNAGGTVSNLYRSIWPDVAIDGVEIDPLVSDVGRRYLGMGGPALTVHTADARVWLRASDDRFDGIVVDAYRQPYIPFHLVSREFFTTVAERLEPSGVVAINVGTPPDRLAAVDMIASTMRDVFPAVQRVRIDDFNSVVLGFARARTIEDTRRQLSEVPSPADQIAADMASDLRNVLPGGTVLTDDHAPIEWVTDASLIDYLRAGAPGSSR